MKNIEAEDIKLELEKILENDEPEDHEIADDLLCKLLRRLGYDEIVDIYEDIEKWYA